MFILIFIYEIYLTMVLVILCYMMFSYDIYRGGSMTGKVIITKKPPKGEDGYKIFSIRIKEELFDGIEDLSAKTGRTRNELIGMLLEFGLSNAEVGTGR